MVDDVHAIAVESALKKKGENVISWHWWDFPSVDKYSFNFDGAGNFRNSITEAITDDVSIWIHRGLAPVPSAEVHPADAEFVVQESRLMLHGMLNEIAKNAFCVNPPQAVSNLYSKINELTLAVKCQLNIPPTLFSNDPSAIRKFFDRHEDIVMKHSNQTLWQSADGSLSFPYTAKVTSEHLVNDQQLRACPTIFQKLIEKAFELRIVFIGETIFAVKIDSQKSQKSLDWRKDYDSLPPCSPFNLPERELQKIKTFVSASGLMYGSIDIVVTKNGDYVFLEVNETGQFLWIEYLLPTVPLLDCFANFLISRNPRYQYKKESCEVRYADIFSECTDAALEQRKKGHMVRPNYGVKFED
jgi:hypothetical protein